jgi:hypothetical protein
MEAREIVWRLIAPEDPGLADRLDALLVSHSIGTAAERRSPADKRTGVVAPSFPGARSGKQPLPRP